MKSKEKLESIRSKIIDTIQDAFGTIQSEVQTVSNCDDLSYGYVNRSTQDERELLDNTIHVATEHLLQLKTRINMLAPINKLPVELWTYIILLTAPSSIKQDWRDTHPYISVSGVCRYWRSVIIQNPDFWTLIQSASTPFVRETLQRSKPAKLDVIIRNDPPEFASALSDLFAKESSRIRTIRLLWRDPPDEKIIRMILSSKQFPSLRSLVLDRLQDPNDVFVPLLPVLPSSEHLETLQCTLNDTSSLDQLLHIISRLKNLDLRIRPSPTPAIIESLLKKSTNLRSLRLKLYHSRSATSRTLLPELHFLSADPSYLLDYFQTPKLSTLETTWDPDHARFGVDTLLGSKNRLHCESLFSTKTEYFVNERLDIQLELSEIDIISENFPHGVFCFNVSYLDDFLRALGLSLLLPRLTNLREFYIFSSSHTSLREIMTKTPSVEKFVVQHRVMLLEFIEILNDTSILPRLKHLSYKTSSIPQNLEAYLEVVGKSLTECVKLRQRSFPHALEFVALGGRCPYLPVTWLKELQKLGTKVVTSKGPEIERS
ncbi:hypothetical protein Clacol_007952 [Clathrus columnatus]|uniref:F-box domain-containing protein n=1 Tax=Clathrus columnatus TaxID=1419009 RepID=A0AAV5AGD1_9AGAM|nr:hypothetical protein Clacol_007952 [Clathrus columnatus]